MDQCAATEERDIFESQSLKDIIDFKWNEYGMNLHRIGCIMHISQIVVLIFYVDFVYIRNQLPIDPATGEYKENTLALVLLAGLIYPTIYESIQVFKFGASTYLSEFGNYFDLLYIWGSVAMSIIHVILSPFNFLAKIVMISVIFLSVIRTFKFLRIFQAYSPIVTMLQNVIYDLRIFLFFYIILTALFSLLIGVLGIGNRNVPGIFKDTFGEEESGFPGVEYKEIGLFVGNIINTLRVSTGDFEIIGTALYLEEEENIIFWVFWVIIVGVTCIVFLNFIIAEAGASYENVNELMDQYILQDKAAMIAEAEIMMPQFLKSNAKFPKYIIIRQIDN